MKRTKQLTLGLLIGITLVFIIAAAPMAVRYFYGGLVIDGTRDEIQLRVQGYTTQTNQLLVLEQSDGTDVLTVTNAGNLGYNGTSTFGGNSTVNGKLLIDGQADAIQLQVQGYTTQTNNLLTLEQSDGTDVLGVANTGNTTMAGTVANSTAAYTVADNAIVDGQADAVQLTVQGYTTQTNNLLTLEQSDGTDVLGVANTGNVTIAGTVANSTAAFTVADNAIIDGQADAIQLTVQGNGTQTSNLLTLEQSDGTDVLTVTNAGALGVASTLRVDGAADFGYVQSADSGATGDSLEVAFTSPVDTAGTNTHNAVTVDLAIGNATGGANTVTGLQIDAITDDPQVTEKAINIGDEWDYAIDTGLPVVASAMQWFDDFIGDEVQGQYTEVSGTDPQAVQAIQEEQFGAYQLTSGDVGSGVAADLEAVYLSLEWQADQGAMVFETRLHLDTDVATVELCAGFTDDVSTVELPFTNSADTVTAVADDAVMFCFDTGATTDEWWVNGATAGTEATGIAATGVVPVADTYQTLRIEVDDGGADCRFYIDGSLVGTLTANCVTPTDLLAPGIVISSGGAAASNVVDVDYILVGAARD